MYNIQTCKNFHTQLAVFHVQFTYLYILPCTIYISVHTSMYNIHTCTYFHLQFVVFHVQFTYLYIRLYTVCSFPCTIYIPVHTSMYRLSIFIRTSSPGVVPKSAPVGLFLVAHQLRDSLHT